MTEVAENGAAVRVGKADTSLGKEVLDEEYGERDILSGEEHASSLSSGDKSLLLAAASPSPGADIGGGDNKPADDARPADGAPSAGSSSTQDGPTAPKKKKRGGRLLESMMEQNTSIKISGVKGYATNETPVKRTASASVESRPRREKRDREKRDRDASQDFLRVEASSSGDVRGERTKSVSFDDVPNFADPAATLDPRHLDQFADSGSDDWTESEYDMEEDDAPMRSKANRLKFIPPSPSLTHMDQQRVGGGRKSRKKPPRKMEQVGKVIKKGDSTYEAMFDILLGIRYAVSITTAKERCPLQPPDFYEVRRLNFPSAGSTITPPHPGRDFSFRDYAPKVFRHLREKFGIDSSDYLMSLTNNYELSQVGSPGKSGSLFYYTRDTRYMLKTVTKAEATFLKTILRPYYEHIMRNPSTLIIRFYGFHRVQQRNGPRLYLVVMGNIFAQSLDIHERYDLKGSTLGRTVGEKKLAQRNPKTILKDLDFQRKFILGPRKREIFFKQLEEDSTFLAKMSIMDYSLLVGINTVKKEHEKLMQHMEKQREAADLGELAIERGSDDEGPASPPDAVEEQFASVETVKRKRKSTIMIYGYEEQNGQAEAYEDDDDVRFGSIYVQDDGGFGATDEFNAPVPEIYFMGIIDILQPYNAVKRFEHHWKALRYAPMAISSIDPVRYAVRFRNFFRDKVSTEGATELQGLYEKNEQVVSQILGQKEKKKQKKQKKKAAREAFLEEQREEKERMREQTRKAELEAKEIRKGIKVERKEIHKEIKTEKREARKSIPLMDAKKLKKMREKAGEGEKEKSRAQDVREIELDEGDVVLEEELPRQVVPTKSRKLRPREKTNEEEPDSTLRKDKKRHRVSSAIESKTAQESGTADRPRPASQEVVASSRTAEGGDGEEEEGSAREDEGRVSKEEKGLAARDLLESSGAPEGVTPAGSAEQSDAAPADSLGGSAEAASGTDLCPAEAEEVQEPTSAPEATATSESTTEKTDKKKKKRRNRDTDAGEKRRRKKKSSSSTRLGDRRPSMSSKPKKKRTKQPKKDRAAGGSGDESSTSARA